MELSSFLSSTDWIAGVLREGGGLKDLTAGLDTEVDKPFNLALSPNFQDCIAGHVYA